MANIVQRYGILVNGKIFTTKSQKTIVLRCSTKSLTILDIQHRERSGTKQGVGRRQAGSETAYQWFLANATMIHTARYEPS